MTIDFKHIKYYNVVVILAAILTFQMVVAQETSPISQDTVELLEPKLHLDRARDFSNRNQTDLALEELEKASKSAEANEDVKALIDSYQAHALLYLKLNKEETTYFFWDRAKALLKDIEYPYGDAMQKYIEAILLFHDGKNFQAIFLLNEAKQLNNDRNFFNNILLAEAQIYMKLDKYESAAKNFNSLIVNTDIYESDYLATKAHLGLADLYLKTDKLEESAMNGESALKLAKKNAFSTVLLICSNSVL